MHEVGGIISVRRQTKIGHKERMCAENCNKWRNNFFS